jgi:hypothetical protein
MEIKKMDKNLSRILFIRLKSTKLHVELFIPLFSPLQAQHILLVATIVAP